MPLPLTGDRQGFGRWDDTRSFLNAKDTHMPNQQVIPAPHSPLRAANSSRRRIGSSSGAAGSGTQPEQAEASEPEHQKGKKRTKQDKLIALLVRDEGTTIAQMVEATGWLPHTVRAALTGLRKKGYTIDSDKVGDTRTFRAAAPQ